MTADSGDIVTCIWTEEGVQVISEGMALCQGTGLAVAGSDIYVAGNAYDMDYDTYEEIYRSPVLKTARKWRSKSSAPTTSPCGGSPAPSSTRKSNSARRPSFTRPDTPKQRPGTDSVPGRSSYGAVYSRRPTGTTVTSTPDSCNRSITEAGALSSVMI